MSEGRKVGRPKKAAEETFTHYIFARLLSEEDRKLNEIARKQGFPINGGRSAAARYAINKIHALLFPKKDQAK